MAAMLAKLKRTELLVVLLFVTLVLLNHFLGWGLTIEDLGMAAVGVASYAVSRGLAKTEAPS